MKILHTSDWHLGRSLYGRKRYDEFSAFLDWLSETIEAEHIDILLVAGDVFDTSTPSNRAQQLYYRFLCRVAASPSCQHVVVIAGNHDSPTFLNAPKELLQALSVHVVGAMTAKPEDEVIVLNHAQEPQAIICAVPYLRDKDIRTASPSETIDDKNAKLVDGLKQHYALVCDIAEQQQKDLAAIGHKHVPIISMGHLFVAGGKTIDNDGVRDLYVGSLAHVGTDIFPKTIDYLALGHLHVPQMVGGKAHMRYCGSPIPMGFGEARQTKKVIVVTYNQNDSTIQEISIPCFQPLVRIVGTLEKIETTIKALVEESSTAWLEIEYTGSQIVVNLQEHVAMLLEGSCMEVRRVKNKQLIDRVMNNLTAAETLNDLNEQDVFTRCLDAFDIDVEDRTTLQRSYDEIVQAIQEEDVNAE